MTAFTLDLPARITFGPGTAAGLASAVASYGSRPLVVTGSDPSRVSDLLRDLGDPDVFRVVGEPTIDDARAAAEAGRRLRADVVVAIGGGSAIDLAKAAAMLLGNGGDPLDYIEVVGRGQPISRPSLPLVAVPTTAGTGAEATANSVLASTEHGVKASLRSPSMIPRHAIVDPLLTLDCPPAVTASSGMDALTQCLEPYVSTMANPATDGWARTGLIRAGRSLRPAYLSGADIAARTDLALCSLMGGLALANAKLGAVHGFAAVLGGMSGAPHGTICAALLVPVCRANIARASGPAAERYDDVARWLTGDDSASASAGLDWIDETREILGIPGLAELGLSEDRTEEVVAKAARASSMKGNPVPLSAVELAGIYREALGR